MLYRRHRHAVTAYVRRRAPEYVVEDIVAETFLVCWRRRDRLPEETLPWLYAVALRTLANDRRKRCHADRAARVSGQPLATEIQPAGDALLAAAFAQLSESDREVLCLIAWEGLSTAQAAKVLECSSAACRVRLHRARRRLDRHLSTIAIRQATAAPLPEGASR